MHPTSQDGPTALPHPATLQDAPHPHPALHTERQRRTRAKRGRLRPGSDLLEEVLLAVDAPGPGEAPVSQLHLAVCTLEAGAVPVSVQDLQDELVQDVLVAASALRDLCGESGEGQCEPSAQHRSPDQALRGRAPIRPGWQNTGLPHTVVQAAHCTKAPGQGGRSGLRSKLHFAGLALGGFGPEESPVSQSIS